MTTATAFDQSTDLNGQDIHRILSLYGAPAFVKQASGEAVCGDETLPPHMFADISRRRWPCHSAPATWMSAAFFYEKKAELPAVDAAMYENRLLNSADFFGVKGEIDTLREKIAEAQTYDEAQLPDSTFAIVMDYDDGRKERHYPMRNAVEVKKASDYLLKYRDHFRFDDRRRIADKLLEKAAAFGANIADHREALEKMSGLGACSSKEATDLIRKRTTIVPYTEENAPICGQMEKLAQMIEESPGKIQHHSTLTTIASVVDQFDREHNLVRDYGKGLDRPEDVLFGVTQKVAADISDMLVGTLTGNYYKKADLERVPVTSLRDALGEDFVGEVSTAGAWVDPEKLAEIAPTLPLSDAETFDAVMIEAGISPYAVKSASVGRELSPQLLLQKQAKRHKGGGEGSLWSHIPS
jgi:hypothetical protein